MEPKVGCEKEAGEHFSFRKSLGRKFKFNMPWNKSSSVDYDNSELVDEFVKDVIQRAKQEYLSECNGYKQDHTATNGYHDQTGEGRVSPHLPPPISSDEEDTENKHLPNDKVDDDERLRTSNFHRAVTEGLQQLEDRSQRQEADNSKGDNSYRQEKKPLLEKSRGGHSFLQHLYSLFCCQCICETYDVT